MKNNNKHEFIQNYLALRKKTEALCGPLAVEDYVIQSIPDVSPPKWHLAHTSWFFETFVLIPKYKSYKIFNTTFHHLFNSYYQGIGSPYPRNKRGLLSRPTVNEIYAYRKYIDDNLLYFIDHLNQTDFLEILPILILGIHHEQQHQELLLTDIKFNLSKQPDFPSYTNKPLQHDATQHQPQSDFIEVTGGITVLGHQNNTFCFDNELPPHQQLLAPFFISTRLVSNMEYLEFIAAGGYVDPVWWLADGWHCVQKNKWRSPLYWIRLDDKWFQFTLSGLQKLDPNEPATHVSYYEADAYARWRRKRLPTEIEWEHFVKTYPIQIDGNFLESDIYHPVADLHKSQNKPTQFFGDVWEWTATPYCAYPGYQPLQGVLGEYNGKFMSNQMVLRGGSCVTPKQHIRHSYRNFFQPDKRWQFTGIRLADQLQKRTS